MQEGDLDSRHNEEVFDMEEIHRLEKKNYCLVRGLPW